MMMMMVVMVVVMMRLTGRWSGGRRRRGGFLRDRVSSQADRESGGCDKTLDHGEDFLCSKRPHGSSSATIAHCA
jgi:hypothetical protein